MLPDHGRCFRRAAARGGGLAAGGLEPPGSGLSLRALPSLAPRPRFCPKTQGVFIRLGCRAMEVARLLQNQRGNSFCKGRGGQEASEEEWGAGTEWKEGRSAPPRGQPALEVSPPTPAIAVGGWGAAEQGVGAPTWWGLCKVSRVPVATLQGRAQASSLSKNLPSSSSCRSNQSPQSLKRSRYFSVGNASGARLPGANLSRHRASPQTREDRRTTCGPARRPTAALPAAPTCGPARWLARREAGPVRVLCRRCWRERSARWVHFASTGFGDTS